MGRCGGQVVIVHAIYSDNPSSNPDEAYIFSVKFVFEKKENKQKEVGDGEWAIFKKISLPGIEPVWQQAPRPLDNYGPFDLKL